MVNKNTRFQAITSRIILKGLVIYSLLFLMVTQSYAEDCPLYDIWAPSDCQIEVSRIQRKLTFNVSCSKRAAEISLAISSLKKPTDDGRFTPEEEFTAENVKFKQFRFENLKIDTLYYYVLRVRDKNGCESHRWGGTWTNQRSFTVFLQKLLILASGDQGETGEVAIHIWPEPFDWSNDYIKIGGHDDSWAEDGKWYTPGGSFKMPNPEEKALKYKIILQEYDYNSHRENERIFYVNLEEWDKNGKSSESWTVTVDGGSPAAEFVFHGVLVYTKGENRPDLLVAHPPKPKPVHSTLPSGSTEIETVTKEQLYKFYLPPPPEIAAPVEGKDYINVPVDLDIRFPKSPDFITATALDIQFFFPEGGTWPYLETVIIGYDGSIPGEDIVGSIIPLQENESLEENKFSSPIQNAMFTKKGTWGLRARVLVKHGTSDKWVVGDYSETRTFYVNTFDPESSKKISLQPIVIKSPKGLTKWPLGSNMKIIWLATGVTKPTKITILKNGVPAGTIADNIITPQSGRSVQTKEMVYNWKVGDKIKSASGGKQYYKIKIEEKGKFAAESSLFEIIQAGSQRNQTEQATTRSSSPTNKAATTPSIKKQQQIKRPSKSLRVISPQPNQSFNFRSDVVIKTDHDSRFPIKYELKKGNGGRFGEVKLNGGALKGLAAGNYSLRISYQNMAPGKPINFTIKKQQSRAQATPPAQKRTQPQTPTNAQQRTQPQTPTNAQQPATRENTNTRSQ